MAKMIEISAAEYERLNDCIREDGMRIAALIEENKALHQDVRRLTTAQKAKRELTANKGAGLRYEEEIARLKRMAAEDILLAARWGSPCDSCVNITKGDDCDKGNCEYCENHCVCQECNYSESFAWRGVQEEKPKARGGKLYAYPIILTEEENGAYSVLIPDFGCATCGKDEIEARFKAAECIVGRMIAMRDDNEPFPAPAEMTDGLLRESCVSVGTEPGANGGGTMMDDLIERKEAIEAIKKYGKDALSAGRRTLDPVDDIVELCNMLDALPAVDAVPVVHGRCTNCGAKMDGEGDAE